MSMEALRWAREPRPELSHPAASVLRDIADRANDNGECWPSVATIAGATRLSRRTVQRALRELETAKLITSKRTGRGNRYKLPAPDLAHQRRHSDASEASEWRIRGVTVTPKASKASRSHKAAAPPTARAAAAAYAPNRGEIPADVNVDQAMLDLARQTMDGWSAPR